MIRVRTLLLCLAVLMPLSAVAADTLTEQQRELLDELLSVVHADQLWEQMIDIAIQAVQPTVTPQELARFRTLLASRVNGTDVLRDIYTKVYFKYYTEDDLRSLIAFYKTPLGRKMLATMPKVTADSMTEAQKTLAPQMMAVYRQIESEREQRRNTLRDMHDIGTALDAWALSEGTGYPEDSDLADLSAKLKVVSDHIPVNDAWGHPYRYVVSADRKHYRLVSAGSDGTFESESLRVTADVPATPRYTDALTNDIIFADGKFVQLPQAWHQ
jgi:hypothetical protein